MSHINRSIISRDSKLNLDIHSLKNSPSLCFNLNRLMAIFFGFLLLIKCAMNYLANSIKEVIEFRFKLEYQFYVAFMNVKGKNLHIFSSNTFKKIICVFKDWI